MSEWREVTLGDVATNLNRRRVPLSKRVRAERQGPFPYYGAQGIVDHVDDFIFDGRYLLVAEDGENLRSRKAPVARIAAGRFWVNNHAHILEATPGNSDITFLLHATNQAPLSGLITGAAQPKLTKAALMGLRIPCPDFLTQRRIAAVLSAFDEQIEINERRVVLLRGVAQALYRKDFGRANADVGGQLPPGWRRRRLGEVAKLRYGKSLPARQRRQGNVPVVGSSGIVGRHDEPLIESPGVVIGRKGNVGAVYLLDESFFPIDTTFYLESTLPPEYLFFALQDLKFVDSHAAVPGLNRSQAESLEVLVPSEDALRSFARQVGILNAGAKSLRVRLAQLAATRDLLLPRLVTGRLDISEVDLGVLEPAEVE